MLWTFCRVVVLFRQKNSSDINFISNRQKRLLLKNSHWGILILTK